MARVWPDTIVEDANLSVTVSALRRGLGRHAGDPAWVETVPRRGYRFAGPLRAPETERPARARRVALPRHRRRRAGSPGAGDRRRAHRRPHRHRERDGAPHGSGRALRSSARGAPRGGGGARGGRGAGRDRASAGPPGAHRRAAHPAASRSSGLGRALRGRGAGHLRGARPDCGPGGVRAPGEARPLARARPRGPPRRPGFEAWETYLRGRYFWARLDTDGVSKALGCFGEAASREPAWAEPRAGLAAAHVLLGLGGVVPPRRAWRVADECAREALERDATLPEAHLASAWVALYRDWAWTEARVALDRAAVLGLPDLHHWRAFVLALQGELGPAAEALARARETDPFSAVALALQGLPPRRGGGVRAGPARGAPGGRAPRRALPRATGGSALALTRLGRHDEAVASLHAGRRPRGGRHRHAVRAGLGAGRRRAARRGHRRSSRGWKPRRRRCTYRPTSGRRSCSPSANARPRWTSSTRPRRTGTPGSPSSARTTPLAPLRGEPRFDGPRAARAGRRSVRGRAQRRRGAARAA